MSAVNSTTELSRVLGRKELFSVAVGQIVGAGIFTMAGIGIGMTGKSVNLAFILAALITIVNVLAVIIIGGTIRLRGGQYTQAGLLLGDRWAGFQIIVFVAQNLSIALYAISFSQYLSDLVGKFSDIVLPSSLVAILVLTFFYITNLIGMKGASRMQNVLVLILLVALAAFIVFGIPQIDTGYFDGHDLFTNGASGFLQASAFLTFATGGATVIINLGAEAKNPTKDIPVVIIVSTLVVAVFYALVSTVAAGVLPISEVANQSLSLVAEEIFSTPMYVFFMVCGALFALSTTLNAQLGWATKPLMQAAEDGWFPKSMTKLNKHNVPAVFLTIMYIIGVVPIIFGFSVESLGNYVLIANYITFTILAYSLLKMDTVIPEAWAKSKYHMSRTGLWLVFIATLAINLIQTYFLTVSFNMLDWTISIAIIIIPIIFAIVVYKKGTVSVTKSYEEV